MFITSERKTVWELRCTALRLEDDGGAIEFPIIQ